MANSTDTAPLAAFLAARLDEEEAALRAIDDSSEPWRGEWEGDEANFALRTRNGWSLARAVTVEQGFPPGVLAHIVRYDPARVLREVEAGRKLIAAYEKAVHEARSWQIEPEDATTWRLALEYAIALRAAVYSDHPDYRQEWKP